MLQYIQIVCNFNNNLLQYNCTALAEPDEMLARCALKSQNPTPPPPPPATPLAG